LGGVFSDFLTWRWIFFVNIPLGAFAAWMLIRHFHEDVKRTRHTIDVAGAVLLTTASTLLIFGLLEGGVLWSWASPWSVGVLGVGVLLLIAFAGVERRAAEPIVPGWVSRRRLLVGTNLTNLAVGVMLIGLTSYVPLFVQDVLGTSALIAGFALAALTIGWPLSASLSGRVYLKIGFRNTALIGTGFAALGGVLMVLLDAQTTVWQVALTCFVIGLGMGLVASPTLVAAQSSVDWASRGLVTGTSMFARSMGSAVGIAVFGAIANAALGTHVGGHGSATTAVPAVVLEPALHQVFVASAVVALLLLAAVAIIPRRTAEATH
jgi:MFS family permease